MREVSCRKRMYGLRRWVVGLVWLAWAWQVALAQDQPQAPPAATDLTQVSLESLMNMEATSASKKEQKLSQTASAIFVITEEDIRESGATNIPDLLRKVPGLDVAQINANTWAIRGLNSQFSNELLVLVDGRNVYTPSLGGVFWGENAVNGVVNIILKNASETPRRTGCGRNWEHHTGIGGAAVGRKAGQSDGLSRLFQIRELRRHAWGKQRTRRRRMALAARGFSRGQQADAERLSSCARRRICGPRGRSHHVVVISHTFDSAGKGTFCEPRRRVRPGNLGPCVVSGIHQYSHGVV